MIEAERYKSRVEETVAFLAARLARTPEIVIELGTGLGSLAGAMEIDLSLPYGDIPHFPRATVTSHAGNLVCGQLGGRPVAVLQGRLHCYEGYSAMEVAFPIRVLSLLGAETAIITNAAGGLNTAFVPGSIMVFTDHINLLGLNPLRGPNVDEWGPRFPDLSRPYDRNLIDSALTVAAELGLGNIKTGTYVCVPGPSLETPAETRFLQLCGADAVGMSSIPEILVAIHGGMRVLGLSVIANVNDPDRPQPVLLEEIVKTAQETGPVLQKLIRGIVARYRE
ncbi:purine nucleoside phosphorylase 1 [bacterium BMS3Bbin14]|nr:purine nucleoside phosphorylase 1 [bacterium BMS3Abin13]GBE53491.1 purine nucleoside phosphorylase 1 [bacterium BMS3Bbin14]HDK44211.1 purine-nucleoside phosphorylase [Desulfobacteraceae bacterium]HDO30152.1 purine-nucleoside phosphorylase [Desulfobacteraceae bacterium]HDZ75987.1 purine-nucleoside phosphorylase [Desulfobacteraceae bacterium]